MNIVSVNNESIEIFSDVLIEAARWLRLRNEEMWKEADITPSALLKRYGFDEMKLCYEGPEVVGVYVLQWYDPLFWSDLNKFDSGIIHKLAVNDRYRGNGYGRKIIESAEELCRKNNVSSIKLNCGTHRDRLRNFYENAGYKLVDRVFIDNRDQVRYEKKILV